MAATDGSSQKDSPENPDHTTATVENTRRKGGEKRLEKRGTPPPSASGLLRWRQGERGGGEAVFGWSWREAVLIHTCICLFFSINMRHIKLKS
jgi:hypothetical protein